MSEICYIDNNNNKMISSGKRWAQFKRHFFSEYRSISKDKFDNLEQHKFHRKHEKIERLTELKMTIQCLPFIAVKAVGRYSRQFSNLETKLILMFQNNA